MTAHRFAPFRVVLVRISGAAADDGPLRHAGRFAEAFDAHVRVLLVPAVPPTIRELAGFGPESPHFGTSPSPEAERQRLMADARGRYETWLAASAAAGTENDSARRMSAELLEIDGDEPTVVGNLGTLADLVVTGRPSKEGGPAAASVLEASLFRTGRPVLMVPPTPKPLSFERPLIAWNGSPQAARALAAALPVLQLSEQPALVLSVPERGSSAEPAALIAYLKAHAIAAEIADASRGAPGEQLLELARNRGSGFIVAGAFSHGRLRQALFGGVTTMLANEADVPVLMAA